MAAMAQPLAGAAQAMGMAQTVLGPLDVSRLGLTLPHEHIADAPRFHLPKWPRAWGGRTEFTAKAVEKLKRMRAAGIGTIVDLTPTGQRFFPPQSADVPMPSRTVAGLAEFFIREIEQGIDGTGIRAGVIKIGVITQNVTALEEIGLRAAARASKATGAPIRTHTAAAHRAGESHAAILEDEGVDPARVSFDHSDDSGDLDYFLGLARRGYSLGMDHVHRGMSPDFQPPFARRAECIRLLAAAGHAGKIFLSQDSEFGGSLLPPQAREWRDRIDPSEGLLFVTRKLLPYLRQAGTSDRDIHTMTVENPQSFFRMS